MKDRVVEAIARYAMLSPGRRVGLAVSGGADSVALLHLFASIATDLGLSLHVLHLNHGLRAAESDGDEQFVGALACGFGLPFTAERASIPPGPALEERARQARRDFFAQQKHALGLDAIATGHTLDDQAETVLFRLLRGTGLPGLAGIAPVTPEGFIRPLLGFTRAEIRAWLQANRLSWREDSSNSDLRFARNRIRHELVPALTASWNPNLSEALARLARQAFDEEQAWCSVLDPMLDQCMHPHPSGYLLELKPALSFSQGAMRRLLRLAARRLTASPAPDSEWLDRAAEVCLRRRGSGSVEIEGLRLERSFSLCLLSAGPPPASNYNLPLTFPGACGIPRSGLEVEIQDISGTARETGGSTYNGSSDLIDGDRCSGVLELRNWRAGDSYQPAGTDASRKLKTLFQSRRIPSWERPEWPMVTCKGLIVWSRLFGVAQWAAAGPASQKVFRIGLRSVKPDAESGVA